MSVLCLLETFLFNWDVILLFLNLIPECCRFVVKMWTEHLTIRGDQHDVVLCVCVMGSDHRILSVTRTKGHIRSLVPLVVPVDIVLS